MQNTMKIHFNLAKYYLFFLISTLLIFKVHGQVENSNVPYYKIYDDFVGIENSELNNGTSFLQQFRSLDRSHTFFGVNEFIDGRLVYNDQVYKTKLKYDIVEDLVIIKYIESSNIFSLNLNSKLISSFSIAGSQFVRLPENQGLSSLYENGFFEELYKGNLFSAYVKHKKKTKKNTEKGAIHYYFKDGNTYLFLYENTYYEINSKKDIYKVVPHLKKQILNHFSRHPKINSESLALLFKQLDKLTTK